MMMRLICWYVSAVEVSSVRGAIRNIGYAVNAKEVKRISAMYELRDLHSLYLDSLSGARDEEDPFEEEDEKDDTEEK
jgi:hypothetical protein